MPGVILYAGQVLNEVRHPGQGPEVRGEAVRPRALPQGRFEPAQLLGRQTRFAPGPPRGAQRRAPALPPRAVPPQDALATDAQPASDRSVGQLPRGKQSGRREATFLESLEIASRPLCCTHTLSLARVSTCVTILCENQ